MQGFIIVSVRATIWGSYSVHPSLSLGLHTGITPLLLGPDIPQLMKPFVFSNESRIMDTGACSRHGIRRHSQLQSVQTLWLFLQAENYRFALWCAAVSKYPVEVPGLSSQAIAREGTGSKASRLGWLDPSHHQQPPDQLILEPSDVPGVGADFGLPVSVVLLRIHQPAWCRGATDGNDPMASLENLCFRLLTWADALSLYFGSLWYLKQLFSPMYVFPSRLHHVDGTALGVSYCTPVSSPLIYRRELLATGESQTCG